MRPGDEVRLQQEEMLEKLREVYLRDQARLRGSPRGEGRG